MIENNDQYYRQSLYAFSRPIILECLKEICSPYKKEEVLVDPKRMYISLHYIINGKGTISYRGKNLEVGKGDLFIIPPSEGIFYQSDKDDPFSYYWVVLAGQSAYEMLEEIGLNKENVLIKCEKNHTEIVDLFSRMNRVYLEYPNSKYEILGWFYLLFSKLKISLVVSHDYNRGHYVNQAVILVGCSFFNPYFTVEDICANLNLSLSYLSRVFKRDMNMSPKQYLTFIRIKNACDLLVQTNRTISTIAGLSGFVDTKLFARNFKKCTGMTATSFREKFKRENPHDLFAEEKSVSKHIRLPQEKEDE